MSRIPIGSQTLGADIHGPGLHERYPDGLVPQGMSAELIADRRGFSRQRLDDFCLANHRKAAQAWAEGASDREVSRLKAPGADAELRELRRDETIRPDTTIDALAALRPAFATDAWRERFPRLD